MFERKQLAPGVFLTTLDADKFNRCRITIHLRYAALRRPGGAAFSSGAPAASAHSMRALISILEEIGRD